MCDDLEPYEANTRVFIVKIWQEESQQERQPSRWRGHITDATSGERRYIDEFHDIIQFIIPYLGAMGVKTSWFWRLANWLKPRAKQDGGGVPKRSSAGPEHGTDS